MLSKKLVLLLLISLSISTTRQDLLCGSLITERSRYIDPKNVSAENSFRANSLLNSTQRSFRTDPKRNFTLQVDLDIFNSNIDCNNGGPFVRVIIFPKQPEEEEVVGCYLRTGALRYPLISSNEVEIQQCNPIVGSQLKFTLVPRLAGYTFVTKEQRVYKIHSLDEVQWIAARSYDRNLVMQINIAITKIRYSHHKNCKRGYLRIRGESEETNEEICNHYAKRYKRNFVIYPPDPIVNITFLNATFVMTAKLISRDLVPTEAVTSSEAPPSEQTDSPSEYSDSPSPRNSPKKNKWFIYVGIGMAIIFILLVIFLVTFLWRRNYCPVHKSPNKMRSSELTYVGNESLKPTSDKDGQSLSNAIYGKIVTGNNSDNSPQSNRTTTPLIAVPEMESKAKRDLEKRNLRLSQLDEKYLDFHISKKTNLPVFDRGIERPKNLPPQSQSTDVGDPRATFNHTRPPQPLPHQRHHNAVKNAYESVYPHLSKQDLVAPAYCTVDEDEVGKLPSDKPEAASSVQSLPLGEYGYSECPNEENNSYPKAIYSSTDSLDEEQHKSKDDAMEAGPSYPLKGRDGYLSVNRTPIQESSTTTPELYVSPNNVSSESLEKHFKKPASKPGINLDSTKKSVNDETSIKIKPKVPQKPPRYSQALPKNDLGSKTDEEDHSALPGNHPRYNNPRPSFPNVKSAYTSGDDLNKLRVHLEKFAAESEKLNSLQSEDGLSSVEKDLYDSPRPSLSGSNDSLLDSRRGFYDTPRPSLPCIFPDEDKPFINS